MTRSHTLSFLYENYSAMQRNVAPGIVLAVQPNSHFESCAKDMVLYAKRKGANHLACSLEEAATYSPT